MKKLSNIHVSADGQISIQDADTLPCAYCMQSYPLQTFLTVDKAAAAMDGEDLESVYDALGSPKNKSATHKSNRGIVYNICPSCFKKAGGEL